MYSKILLLQLRFELPKKNTLFYHRNNPKRYEKNTYKINYFMYVTYRKTKIVLMI